jgi:hypothetical protein
MTPLQLVSRSRLTTIAAVLGVAAGIPDEVAVAAERRMAEEKKRLARIAAVEARFEGTYEAPEPTGTVMLRDADEILGAAAE